MFSRATSAIAALALMAACVAPGMAAAEGQGAAFVSAADPLKVRLAVDSGVAVTRGVVAGFDGHVVQDRWVARPGLLVTPVARVETFEAKAVRVKTAVAWRKGNPPQGPPG